MIEKQIFLGQVTSRFGGPFARVQPMMLADTDGASWEEIKDKVEMFPDRGQVFWYEIPNDLQEQSVWQFRVEQSPSYDGQRNREYFQVGGVPLPVIEVIDCRAYGSESDIRRVTTEAGIGLENPPLGHVLLRVDEDRFVGPVKLKTVNGDSDELWILTAPDLSSLQCTNAPAHGFCELSLRGRRQILGPKNRLGKAIGFCNWQPDVEIVRNAVKRLRKLDRLGADTLSLAVEALGKAELFPVERPVEEARAKRIAELSKDVALQADFVEEAARSLLNVPAVQTEFLNLKRAAEESLRQQVEAELAGEIRAKSEDYQQLLVDLDNARGELEKAKKEAKENKATLLESTEALDREISERLAQLKDKPETALAEALCLRPFLARAFGIAADWTPLSSASSGAIFGTVRCDAQKSKTVLESLGHFVSALLRVEIDPWFAYKFTGTILANKVPLVLGNACRGGINAGGRSLAGGRTCWIPVPPNCMGLEDLFTLGSRGNNDGIGLLYQAIIAAQHNKDKLYLVVLEGVNRGVAESCFLPLLQFLNQSSSTEVVEALPLVLPKAVRVALEDEVIVSWPENLLVTATLELDGLYLPVVPETWSHSALALCEYNQTPVSLPPVAVNENNLVSNLQELAPSTFARAKRAAVQSASAALLKSSGIPCYPERLSASQRSALAALSQAFADLKLESDMIKRFAVECYLLPLTLANGFELYSPSFAEELVGRSEHERIRKAVAKLVSIEKRL